MNKSTKSTKIGTRLQRLYMALFRAALSLRAGCLSASAVLFVPQAAPAQPVQSIPAISPMAADIYQLSHKDMNWRGHSYRIYVARPRLSQDRKDNLSQNRNNKTAALYILDGNAQFPLAVNAALGHWTRLSGKEEPAQIATLPLIVGLGYPEDKAYPLKARTRDYTFFAPGEAFAAGGGAADFYDFLRSKVRPYIETQYETDPGRQILAGHSFGGLFALYVLLNHPAAFDDYVIGSPSLWWGNGAIVSDSHWNGSSVPEQKTDIADRNASAGRMPDGNVGDQKKHIMILQGEYEENPKADPNMKPERLVRIQQRRSPINARGLNQWLRARGLDSQFALVSKSGHGGVIPVVIDTAVRQALQKKRQ